MSHIRAATLLTFVAFLAFGFQVIGVFSDPISRGVLPIAVRDGYNYGILGWCPSNTNTGLCSSYGVGYKLQGSSSSHWSSSVQRILSSIMIVHIISAGMLAIALFLVISTHSRKRGLWIFTEFFLCLCFLATTLSFVVEIVLFGTDLHFSGWFALASAVLSLIAVIAMAFMLRNLDVLEATRSRTKNSYNSSIMEGSGGVFENSGFFRTNSNDNDKLLKPDVKVSTTELPPLPIMKNKALGKAPTLKTTSVYHGYQKVPENNSAQFNNEKMDTSEKALPMSPSTDSIGAITKPTPVMPVTASGKALQRPPQLRQGAQAQQSKGQNAQQPGNMAATGAVLTNQNNSRNESRQPHRLPQLPTNSAPSSRNAPDAISIASTDAGSRVPAGSYVRGVEKAERFGPNVVHIPEVREPQSAEIDYANPDKSKVPNYSRLSAAVSTSTSASAVATSPMLKRFVEDEARAPVPESNDVNQYVAPAPPLTTNTGTAKSEGGASSHYSTGTLPKPATNIGSSNAPRSPAAQGPSAQAQTGYTPQEYQQQQLAYQQQLYLQQQQSYMQQLQQQQQQSYMQQSYQPNYQANYQQYYQPHSYTDVGNYGYQQNYNYQQPVYSPAVRQHASPQRRPPAQPAPMRSEMAINSNPDFAIAGMGKRRGGNRRI